MCFHRVASVNRNSGGVAKSQAVIFRSLQTARNQRQRIYMSRRNNRAVHHDENNKALLFLSPNVPKSLDALLGSVSYFFLV
eukprot:06373_5